MSVTGETRSAPLAAALERLGTETAFSVLARAKALERSGRDIVHLEIGEPDFDTAPHVVDAAVAALHGGLTHYCPTPGLDELREAVARYFTERVGSGSRRRTASSARARSRSSSSRSSPAATPATR